MILFLYFFKSLRVKKSPTTLCHDLLLGAEYLSLHYSSHEGGPAFLSPRKVDSAEIDVYEDFPTSIDAVTMTKPTLHAILTLPDALSAPGTKTRRKVGFSPILKMLTGRDTYSSRI